MGVSKGQRIVPCKIIENAQRQPQPTVIQGVVCHWQFLWHFLAAMKNQRPSFLNRHLISSVKGYAIDISRSTTHRNSIKMQFERYAQPNSLRSIYLCIRPYWSSHHQRWPSRLNGCTHPPRLHRGLFLWLGSLHFRMAER